MSLSRHRSRSAIRFSLHNFIEPQRVEVNLCIPRNPNKMDSALFCTSIGPPTARGCTCNTPSTPCISRKAHSSARALSAPQKINQSYTWNEWPTNGRNQTQSISAAPWGCLHSWGSALLIQYTLQITPYAPTHYTLHTTRSVDHRRQVSGPPDSSSVVQDSVDPPACRPPGIKIPRSVDHMIQVRAFPKPTSVVQDTVDPQECISLGMYTHRRVDHRRQASVSPNP